MNSILGFLFILSGVFVVLILLGVWWSIRSGQFDDLEGPAARILMDEDDPRLPGRRNCVDKNPNISRTPEESNNRDPL